MIPIKSIVPIINSTLNNSSYIGAFALATTGKRFTLLPTQMPPIIKQMLTMKVMMAVGDSNTKNKNNLYIKGIKNRQVVHP